MYEFRWIPWNVDHIGKHGVAPDDAEHVVNRARRPFPKRMDDEKRLVWGQAPGGVYLQVIYVFDPDGTVFVIHGMPLTDRQKRQLRRRRK